MQDLVAPNGPESMPGAASVRLAGVYDIDAETVAVNGPVRLTANDGYSMVAERSFGRSQGAGNARRRGR